VFRLINVAGEFLNPDKIAKRLAGYGFVLDSVAIDSYAQVKKLRKYVNRKRAEMQKWKESFLPLAHPPEVAQV